jgi:putative transposase
MALDPKKGRAALRRGRISIPGAEYFLTVCTDEHRLGLTTAATASAILAEMHRMTADGTWTLRCATVMPNQVHLLFVLGTRLPLGQCIQRLKAKTSAALRSAPCEWERDFFDRRLRPGDERLPLFLYIYLNPYHANLVDHGAAWPHFFCCDADWAWFQHHLDDTLPVPEWLM